MGIEQCQETEAQPGVGNSVAAEESKAYSISTRQREGFTGCIIEVPQPLDPHRVKLLEKLGGIVHRQIQVKDAPVIVFIPREAFTNITTEHVMRQEGEDLEGTGLAEALAVSGGVRKILEGDR